MNLPVYNPKIIESKAQSYWDSNKTFEVTEDPSKEKYYCLSMFPYPSGNIHMGHVRNYTIGDVISRYQRMLGKNVLQPFGWDAFGMPAENAAIANNSSPAPWTYQNIKATKEVIKTLGFSFDWSRELTTCKPDYYRWEQWFFTKLFEQGIAYKKPAVVNWCDVDKTVLANEQVEEGCCWRCGTQVRQIELNQWFLASSDFSQELLDSLKTLDQWPENVKKMQENWIGRSDGVEFSFEVPGVPSEFNSLSVYTTRPDTIYGVSYLAIAANHPLSIYAAESNPELEAFIEKSRHVKTSEADLSKLEKEGIALGHVAIHPLTGQEVPIYAANFVLMNYGTGAVMSVPAHDSRDHDFAEKYFIPIIRVIADPKDPNSELPYVKSGVLVNSAEFDGIDSEVAGEKIIDKLVAMKIGERKVNYRYRDWGLSRQRYWGAPIPMLTLEDSGEVVAVPQDQLPVVLPENVKLNGVENPLENDESWNLTSYKGKAARRETDTFDTFMESSWYYARYTSPHDTTQMIDKAKADYWLPVDQYIGGIEHATMHLMYFRYFHKLLRNNGLVSGDEPVDKLVCQGMVLNGAFFIERPIAGDPTKTEKIWLDVTNVTPTLDDKGRIIGGVITETQEACTYAGMIKMSKSKFNGVDPTEIIDLYGADAIRLFIMFAAPIESSLEWQHSGIEGASRFLKRFWNLTTQFIADGKRVALEVDKLNATQQQLRHELHKAIAKVNDDISRRQAINTAIATIMELLNHLVRFELKEEQDYAVLEEAIKSTILMLHPITPHICLELWEMLGYQEALDFHPIAQADPKCLQSNSKTIVVQVNGKLRAKLEVAADADQAQIKELAHKDPGVAKYLDQVTIVKEIYVANKLYNIVVK